MIYDLLKTATEEAKARMASNMEAAQTKLESHLGIVQDLFDEQTAREKETSQQKPTFSSKGKYEKAHP